MKVDAWNKDGKGKHDSYLQSVFACRFNYPQICYGLQHHVERLNHSATLRYTVAIDLVEGVE